MCGNGRSQSPSQQTGEQATDYTAGNFIKFLTEFRALLHLLQDLDAFMEVLDVVKDGKISRNEFMKYYYTVKAQVSLDLSSATRFHSHLTGSA